MAETVKLPTSAIGGGVATKHRTFQLKELDFIMMRHANEGQSCVKRQLTRYLPKPPALLDKGIDPKGQKYDFYLSFAEFPELTSQALISIQGLVHKLPPEIELPRQIEYLRDNATPDGKPLDQLWMDVTREVFLMGRAGLLPEVFENTVRLCQYAGDSIINWRKLKEGSGADASLVVLYEPTEEESTTGDGFASEIIDYFRVLRLTPEGYVEELWRNQTKIADSTGQVAATQPSQTTVMLEQYPIRPQRQGAGWAGIPFVPINAGDIDYDLGPIPLLPVAQKSMDIYRKTATYQRTLYLKGDPPMLRKGFTEEEVESIKTVGGGVIWDASNTDADAMYIEPTGDSIPHQRTSIVDDFEQAQKAAGKLFDDAKGGVESGEALRERRAAQSVTIVGVLQTVADGFERALRNVTEVMGGNPEDVHFRPNLDFMEADLSAADVLQFTQAKNEGAPISRETLHGVFKRGGVTRMEFADEERTIEEEDPEAAGDVTLPGIDDPAPEDDPEPTDE